MPSWLLSAGKREFRRAVSSDPHSPAVAGAQPDILHAPGPVRPRPATVAPATSSAAAGCCETDPIDAAVAQSLQESVLSVSGSRSDAPRHLTELNSVGYLPSRSFAETSPRKRIVLFRNLFR